MISRERKKAKTASQFGLGLLAVTGWRFPPTQRTELPSHADEHRGEDSWKTSVTSKWHSWTTLRAKKNLMKRNKSKKLNVNLRLPHVDYIIFGGVKLMTQFLTLNVAVKYFNKKTTNYFLTSEGHFTLWQYVHFFGRSAMTTLFNWLLIFFF